MFFFFFFLIHLYLGLVEREKTYRHKQIQEFSRGGTNTIKKKSGGTWVPTYSQAPYFC